MKNIEVTTLNQDQTSIHHWLNPYHRPVIIAGPCSAETEEQLMKTCLGLKKTGKVDILRAGIWKPRTRPGSFEGVGAKGLPWLKQVKEKTGLPVAVETAKAEHVEACLNNGVDMLWIGARTTVNPFAVQEIAEALRGVKIPVFVKNPIHADTGLWLGAVERLERVGIHQLAVIHRGFSHMAEKVYRNRPEWQLAIDFMTERPDLPIICDPSHICGNRHMLRDVAQKALDLNYDGLMIESHCSPDNAWSDARQQITPHTLEELLDSLILRQQHDKDTEVQRNLQFLRQELDILDADLINLLGERMGIARRIGDYKRQNDMIILQRDRWHEMLHIALERGRKSGLNEDFIHKLIRAIHDESITQQEKMMDKD